MTVEVKRLPDGTYDAWEDGTRKRVSTAKVSKPVPYGESVREWASGLTDFELEAAVIIFTERWIWDVGHEEDRICLEAAETELRMRRELFNDLGASGIVVKQIPSQVSPPPPVGTVAVDGVKSQVSVYTRTGWKKLPSK